MKTINKLGDLEQYGIIPLTGEADNLSFRCLCDLTSRGVQLVNETFGFRGNEGYAHNWNSSTNGERHIASVMLPYEAWQSLGIVALMTEGGCHTILVTANALHGLEQDEMWNHGSGHLDEKGAYVQDVESSTTIDGTTFPWPENCYGKVQRIITPMHGHPHQGTRNTHAFSGRTV